jgi:hypothetical protein
MRYAAKALWMAAMVAATPAWADENAPAGEGPEAHNVTVPPEGVPSPATPAHGTPTPAQAASDPVPAAKAAGVEAKTDQLQQGVVSDGKGMIDKVSRLKLSGFVQGRDEWHQDSVNGWDYGARPTSGDPPGNAGSSSKSTFYVRRARLDINYAGTNTELVLQIDAGGDTVALRDAEAAFVDTWTPLHLRVSIGQFRYPFGFELRQRIPDREMPERARMIQQFFPGDRDRGLEVQGRYQMLRFQIALINGNGTRDPIFKAGKDSNAWLDLVGRVGVDFDTIRGGISGYYGGSELYNPSYNATTNPDTNPLHLKKYSRVRVGGDMQGNINVPRLGNLSLRGEIIYSRDKNRDYGGVVADPCQDRVGLGWSLIVAQSLGSLLGVVVRVDGYDPLLQGSLDANVCSVTPDGKPGTYVTAGIDRVITYGGGLLLYVSPNLKASFVYEHPAEQISFDNDVFTAQLQARF